MNFGWFIIFIPKWFNFELMVLQHSALQLKNILITKVIDQHQQTVVYPALFVLNFKSQFMYICPKVIQKTNRLHSDTDPEEFLEWTPMHLLHIYCLLVSVLYVSKSTLNQISQAPVLQTNLRRNIICDIARIVFLFIKVTPHIHLIIIFSALSRWRISSTLIGHVSFHMIWAWWETIMLMCSKNNLGYHVVDLL